MASDRLYLTHMEETGRRVEAEELIRSFPGETYLVNEFGEEKDIYCEELVPDENCLDTKVGLGEPRRLPDQGSQNVYFAGFSLDFCMDETAGKVVEERGEDPQYHILADYSFTNCGENFINSLSHFLEQKNWEVSTMQELEERLAEDDSRLNPSRYPSSTDIVMAEKLFL